MIIERLFYFFFLTRCGKASRACMYVRLLWALRARPADGTGNTPLSRALVFSGVVSSMLVRAVREKKETFPHDHERRPVFWNGLLEAGESGRNSKRKTKPKRPNPPGFPPGGWRQTESDFLFVAREAERIVGGWAGG